MRNIRMTVSYDGTRFHGFQRQPGTRTVQGELEAALERLTGEPVAVTGASRTDAGVHALGQSVNFHTASPIPADRFHLALAPHRPEDLAASAAGEVPETFHARHNAAAKEYQYVTYAWPCAIPFLRDRALLLGDKPDVAAMRAGAAHLVGTHDFSAFGNAGSGPADPVKTVHSLDVLEFGPFLALRVHGTSFLYKMVRNLAGTLLEVGRGRLAPDAVRDILASRARPEAGPTLPPHALYLMQVDYA